MTVIEAVTLAIALLGAALGVINTWHALDNTRVKLRVRPMQAIPVGTTDSRFTFCIEVTNLSSFAVTVNDVGVFYEGTERRGSYTPPLLFDGKGWPRRLESRTSVTVYGQPPSGKPGQPLKCAYARTECGTTHTGTSPAFKSLDESVP